MDWLFDLIREVYDRFAGKIGQQWTLILLVALIALGMFLVIGRGKSK